MAILQPNEPPAPPELWADLPKVVDLAKRKNAVIKISGACTLSKQPYPFPDIWDPLKRIFDTWGFERCLWGTDWTGRSRSSTTSRRSSRSGQPIASTTASVRC